MEENVIVLEDENGEEIEFAVIDVYELNGNTYFALIEAAEFETSEEVVIMRVEGEGENMTLVAIEDDKELDEAFKEFCERDEVEEIED